jgi:hypothetical protein
MVLPKVQKVQIVIYIGTTEMVVHCFSSRKGDVQEDTSTFLKEASY